MKGSISVILADDHTLFRAGMRSLLEKVPGVVVLAEAADGEEAVECVGRFHPRVVLMDLSMPRLNGLEATQRIKRKWRKVRVLILSMHANEEYVSRALQAGADGYMLKDAASVELEQALREVDAGRTYLAPSISREIVEENLERMRADHQHPPLTPAQRQVLQLIAEGYSTREIAEILDIAVSTADTHRMQLMKRLGIHEVVSLVHYAIRNGLVTPNSE